MFARLLTLVRSFVNARARARALAVLREPVSPRSMNAILRAAADDAESLAHECERRFAWRAARAHYQRAVVLRSQAFAALNENATVWTGAV